MATATATAAEVSGATRERIVGGTFDGFAPSGGALIAQAYDDVVRQYGPWVYDLMRQDPAVSGSLNLLFAGILAEGPRVVSALTTDPGELTRSRRRKRDLRLAGEIAEFWQTALDTVQPSYDQTLWELLDEATTGGCALAEPVYRLEESGPYRGKLVLEKLQVKPRGAWGLLVDPYLEVRKFRCLTTDGWRDVDRSHFVFMSWQPRCGDPRGTRILRPGYPAWNIKLQEVPDYAEYLKHFTTPKIALTAGPDAQQVRDTDPATGAVTETTPQQRLLAAGQQWGNFSILTLANGDAVQVFYSQGNGEAFLKGFEWADREIFRSIIIGARGMQEAKHSSKADTDTAESLIRMAVTQARKPLHEAQRNDLLYRGTLLNWGKEVADRFTPSLAFGVSDEVNGTLLQAMSVAWRTGVLGPGQRPWMLAKIGAPQDPAPTPEEQAAAAERDKAKADDQGAAAPATAPAPPAAPPAAPGAAA